MPTSGWPCRARLARTIFAAFLLLDEIEWLLLALLSPRLLLVLVLVVQRSVEKRYSSDSRSARLLSERLYSSWLLS